MNINRDFIFKCFILFFLHCLLPLCVYSIENFESHYQVNLRSEFLSFQDTYPHYTQPDYQPNQSKVLEFFYSSLYFQYSLKTDDTLLRLALRTSSLWGENNKEDFYAQKEISESYDLIEANITLSFPSLSLTFGRFLFNPLPTWKYNYLFKNTVDGLTFRQNFSEGFSLAGLFDILHQSAQIENTYSYNYLTTSLEEKASPGNTLTYRAGFALHYHFIDFFGFYTRYPAQKFISQLSLPASDADFQSTSASHFYFGGAALSLTNKILTYQGGIFPSFLTTESSTQKQPGFAYHQSLEIAMSATWSLHSLLLYHSPSFISFPAPAPSGLIAHSLLGLKLHPEAEYFGITQPRKFESATSFSRFTLFCNLGFMKLHTSLSHYISSSNLKLLAYEFSLGLKAIFSSHLDFSLESCFFAPSSSLSPLKNDSWAFRGQAEFRFQT